MRAGRPTVFADGKLFESEEEPLDRIYRIDLIVIPVSSGNGDNFHHHLRRI
jgi:hypothetical protein